MRGAPRIQARVGQAEEPAEIKGKWFAELFLTFMGAGDDRRQIGTWGPFDTEPEAKKCMRDLSRAAVEAIEQKEVGAVSGGYFDMKTNSFRKWDEN